MQKSLLKRTWKWFRIILLIYIACGIALYFLQEKFLFHPEKLSQDYTFHFPQPFKEINLALNKETNLSIIQFSIPDSLCKGVVLYFHGNMQNVERYAHFASDFTKNNYEVWMMDYPGYGKSTGERTEQILYDDAIQLYKMARARFSKDSIIIYGKSLGTGIAAKLAAVKSCKRLILETPYYSVEALFSHYAFIYPVNWMSKYHFPTHQYIEDVTAPVTLFHGTYDNVIPFEQSKWLMNLPENIFKAGRELVAIKKGEHNNLSSFPLYHQKLDSLLH
jgi:hypothetical protein